jgi:hypothetical protein
MPKPVAAEASANLGDRAFAVSLRPIEAEKFVMAPERAPRPATFGAVLWFDSVDKPGVYQITLSKEAWIDVIQGDAREINRVFRTKGLPRRAEERPLRSSRRSLDRRDQQCR